MAEVLTTTLAESPLKPDEAKNSGSIDGPPLNGSLRSSENDSSPANEATISNNSEQEEDRDGEVLHENGKETTENPSKSHGKGGAKKKGVSVKKTESETGKRSAREPLTPSLILDRPARERKSVDRFVASADRDKVKEFKIEKGHGTQLKDIPNVVYKLSKRTGGDDILQQLHRLLFLKRAKLHMTKSNILQFSGFIWGENKEKEKAKVKERLEKCIKDSLFQISDLLDMNLPKSSKKEELVIKLLDFLELPCQLTDKLLEEKEQKLKEKKKLKSSKKRSRKGTPVKTPRKRQRSSMGSSKKKNEKQEEEEHEEEEEEEAADDMEEQSEEEEETKQSVKESDDEDYDVKSKRSKRGSSKKPKKGSRRKSYSPKDSEDEVVEEEDVEEETVVKSDSDDEEQSNKAKKKSKKGATKVTKISSRKETKHGDESEDEEKALEKEGSDEEDAETKPSKKVKEDSKASKDLEVEEKATATKRQTKQTQVKSASKNERGASSKTFSRSKKGDSEEMNENIEADEKVKATKPKALGKAKGKTKEAQTKVMPSDEELREAICEILQDADFSTATFANVVERLESQLKTSLTEIKSHVKSLIREEISKLAEEAEEDEEEEGGENEDGEEKSG